jgi:hypothetical protein
MANASLGTVAISMTLWLADWGAGQIPARETPPDVTPAAVAPTVKSTCHAGVQSPTDDSDLEVVVCAHSRSH